MTNQNTQNVQIHVHNNTNNTVHTESKDLDSGDIRVDIFIKSEEEI